MTAGWTSRGEGGRLGAGSSSQRRAAKQTRAAAELQSSHPAAGEELRQLSCVQRRWLATPP